MQNPNAAQYSNVPASEIVYNNDSSTAVSWAAIFAGAVAATALTFLFLALGSGFGWASLTSIKHEGMAGPHFKYMVAVWLIITQWVSSALGGYLAGRLRTKWAGVHTHEVFFRDTAHGFLVWALATVLYTLLAFGAASSANNMNMHQDEMSNGRAPGVEAYYMNKLFRNNTTAAPVDKETRAEADPIVWKGFKDGSLPETDKNYLSQLISTHAGIDPSEASKRVDTTIAQFRENMEATHKTAVMVSIFTCLSMLIGAFIACVAAAIGGAQRDEPNPLRLN